MHIGIDIRPLAPGPTGGINLVIKGVLETLFQQHPEHVYTVFTTVFNRSLLACDLPYVKFKTLPILRYDSILDECLENASVDVLFRCFPILDNLRFPLSRQVIFVPDLQHEDHPDFFNPSILRSRRLAFNRVLSLAGAVGTLTETARRRIERHPWTRCQHLFLMAPASPIPLLVHPDDRLLPEEMALIPDQPFFIYPANLWPHKNHRRLLEAFARYHREIDDRTKLVLTGDPSGWDALRDYWKTLPVVHLGYVRPGFLYELMRRAVALVFFSLYEGFGIPLLEAFSLETPVVCSDLPSLREVGGDAVLTVDPLNVGAMVDAMKRISEDKNLRASLVEKGRRRLEHYSWETSAENLNQALSSVVQNENSPSSVVMAESPPLVTIVTPSYNQARFLKRTIESVLHQTYPHIEYIVVDGGSRDGSVDILRSYGNRFTWVSEPDRGQAHAINKGFARSRGEIRAYLNSDDVLMPDAVEKVVNYFIKHPDWDMVYGRALYIDEADREIGKYRTDEYSFERLMKDCCVCQPAAFWRTRIAEKVGEFNESLHYAMDYEYWLRIDRAGGRIVHVHDILAASRLYPETKTLSARRAVYKEIFDVCMRLGGYVHQNYFWGYWYHRLWEDPNFWFRMIRRIPKIYPLVVTAHHLWFHHRWRTPEVLWQRKRAALFRWLVLHFPRLSRRLYHRWIRFFPQVGPYRRVIGFYPEGYLSPVVQIYIDHPASSQRYYIEGRAFLPMTVRVRISGEGSKRYDLQPNSSTRVMVDLKPPGPRRVTFLFSRYVIDHRGRPISFELHDTNLFAERDL